MTPAFGQAPPRPKTINLLKVDQKSPRPPAATLSRPHPESRLPCLYGLRPWVPSPEFQPRLKAALSAPP